MTEAPEIPPTFSCPFKVIEDCEILTDVYLPEGHSKNNNVEKRPVLISFHGGGFLLGARQAVPQLQVQDWLRRGWIVVVPDYRLCPAVNIYDGPVCDARDTLRWVVAGEKGLDGEIARNGSHFRVDTNKIIDSGSSSGGTLAHSCVFGEGLPPVAAIVDFFGGKGFSHPIWQASQPKIHFAKCPPEQVQIMMEERPVCTNAPVLDGKPDLRRRSIWQNARLLYAMEMLSSPNFLDTFLPSGDLKTIDATLNVNSETAKRWPPTWIVHGMEDERVNIVLSQDFNKQLVDAGVKSKLIEVPEQSHAFIAIMERDSEAFAMTVQVFDEVEALLNTL